MDAKSYLSYSDLAWTEAILAPPVDFEKETELFCQAVKDKSSFPVKSLLHLACGAGCNDYTFKKHFAVTGIDISPQMLAMARKQNPEVEYIEGDMRTVRLNREFDAVTIPDSIDYMQTENDLQLALMTACSHLKPGGVLHIVANTKEELRENNFVYSAEKDKIKITVFENNAIPDPRQDRYEAAIIYLIREGEKLTIRSEVHKLGLFSLVLWRRLLSTAGFSNIEESKIEQLYDRYMPEGGRYHLTMFVGNRA